MENEKEFKSRESGKGGRLQCWYAYIYPKNLTFAVLTQLKQDYD